MQIKTAHHTTTTAPREMMIPPTSDLHTKSYSPTTTTMVSGNIGQKTIQNKTSNNNNDTQQDDSSTAHEKQYSMVEICMVAQTSKCLQFHTARIQKISVSTVAVIYISTNEQGIIPIGSQVQSSEHVGRGIERRKVRQSNAINPDSVII